jgi:tetrahydromethanopterin S-methyltransferase subunit B
MVFNLFDLLIADWLVFVKIQPKAIVLPGTEGMAGYKDYAFHFRGFLVGIVFSAVGALVFSLIALALFSFSSF